MIRNAGWRVARRRRERWRERRASGSGTRSPCGQGAAVVPHREAAVASDLALCMARRPHAVLLLPANTRRLAWLPESRKRAFINELESLVSTMRQDGAHEAATPQQEDVGRSADESSEPSPWEHSCAICGGCCCQTGGTTAYLRTAQIARYVQSHPGTGFDDAVRAYASYLPAVSFEGSCVYHARRGCALPPPMRSDVCLSFYCAEHHRVREWFQAEAEVPVLLAAVAGAKVHRLSLFDGRRLHAIPLPAGIVEPPRA